MSREDWGTESGLVTNYVGEVVDAWFAVDEKFGGTRLYLKQTTDNASVPEITENFSVGDKWESYDGGKSIENKDDPTKKKMHASSRYGKLITRVFDELPAEAGDLIASRGDARTAEVWLGTRWRWEEVSSDYTMKQDDGTTKSGTSRYNMPVEFLGTSDAPAAASGGAVNESTGVLESLGLSDDLTAALRAARSESQSHAEFLDKAIALDGVVGNDTLVRALADESQLYKELA